MVKVLANEEKRRMLLQLFAEGDGGGSEGGDDGGTSSGNGNDVLGEGQGGDDGNAGSKLLSFDDFLKQEGNQAEFDRRVQKAAVTAVANAQKKWEALTDDKLSEAEKLAKMTKEERAAYRTKKLEAELASLKHEKEVAELANEARRNLAEDGINIPDILLTNLIGDDAAETKANVESFKELFNNAVSEIVKKKAQQTTPQEGGGQRRGTAGKANLAEMAAKARIIK